MLQGVRVSKYTYVALFFSAVSQFAAYFTGLNFLTCSCQNEWLGNPSQLFFRLYGSFKLNWQSSLVGCLNSVENFQS